MNEYDEYERTHRPRPPVEWSSDEAYERQRALDQAREEAREKAARENK